MKQRSNQFAVWQKILIFVGAGLVCLGLVGLSLYFPVLRNAGTSHGYTCTRAHIYIPVRLDFKGCKTVTGIVTHVKTEKDGDTHVQFRLDKQYDYLLTAQNYKQQAGTLVVEDMCRRNPNGSVEFLAKVSCYHYVSPFSSPIVGNRYEVTGNYVVDDWHGSWAEIHGLSEFKQLN